MRGSVPIVSGKVMENLRGGDGLAWPPPPIRSRAGSKRAAPRSASRPRCCPRRLIIGFRKVNDGFDRRRTGRAAVDAIETAIRNALEKGDASQRDFRVRVYRSAFAALERSLQNNPQASAEDVKRRKDALSAKISEIESEYIAAVVPQPPPQPAAPSPDTELRASRDGPAAPGSVGPEAGGLDWVERDPVFSEDRRRRDEPAAEPPASDYIIEPSITRHDRPPRRRSRFASAFILVAILCALAIGAWAVWQSGFFGGGDGNAVPEAPAEPEDEALDSGQPQDQEQAEQEQAEQEQTEQAPPPLSEGAEAEEWIPVFDPADPTTVTAPAGATAEIMATDGVEFIRIRSGESGSPIVFDVPAGVLEQVAGGRALFSILAQAQPGEETQISIACDFGALGDCGRKRFLVGITQEEFLFDVDLAEGRPGGGGSISINSDVDGTGKSVDIFAIRVSPAR